GARWPLEATRAAAARAPPGPAGRALGRPARPGRRHHPRALRAEPADRLPGAADRRRGEGDGAVRSDRGPGGAARRRGETPGCRGGAEGGIRPYGEGVSRRAAGAIIRAAHGASVSERSKRSPTGAAYSARRLAPCAAPITNRFPRRLRWRIISIPKPAR